MAQATADDGTLIHYQDKGPTKGPGESILFLHEYGGDPRSWEPQVAAFARTHRCLVPATRGYLPSGIPGDADAYSYEIVAEDADACASGARAGERPRRRHDRREDRRREQRLLAELG